MNPLRSPSLRFVLWMGLVFFSIRPVVRVDAALELLFAPARVLADLAPPFGWLRTADVRAAEVELAALAAGEAAQIERLRQDLVHLALPKRSELMEGRAMVRGEVLRDDPDRPDRVLVQLFDTRGVEPGCPAVSGDHYVGRVAELDHGTGVAAVDLVTGGDFFVGARIVEGPQGASPGEPRDLTVRMTVGGVAPLPGGRGSGRRIRLDVHNPSERHLPAGRVVVDEIETRIDAFGSLADGYELGRISSGDSGAPLRERPVVLPGLDYKSGLFQVMVLLAPGEVGSDGARFEGALEDRRWIAVRPLSGGDPSPWRAGLVLDRGVESGVRSGAALVSGTRLLGRVGRAGWWLSHVRLLGDPGLSLSAVARIEGREEPVVLGELIGLGRDAEGGALFAWDAPLATWLLESGETSVEAQLFTGSGDRGLPGGLAIGRAVLSVAAAGDGSTLRLTPDLDPYDLRDLWVRGQEEEP